MEANRHIESQNREDFLICKMENEFDKKLNIFLKAALPFILMGGGLGLLFSIGGVNPSGT